MVFDQFVMIFGFSLNRQSTWQPAYSTGSGQRCPPRWGTVVSNVVPVFVLVGPTARVHALVVGLTARADERITVPQYDPTKAATPRCPPPGPVRGIVIVLGASG
ncbi:MAG: hypothetical protein ACLP7F_07490 [Acidimicrobiales bacterium]